MDEISGLLISGGVLLAASFITGNEQQAEDAPSTSSPSEQNELAKEEKDDDKFDEDLDRELRKQRKRYDAELENILRAHDLALSGTGKKPQQPLIVLGNPFYTSFHKLQEALQTIKIPSVINTNIKQRYLLVQLGQWLLYSSSLFNASSETLPEPDETLLFQIMVSNGLVLIPGSAYANCEPGTFVITRDVQDDDLIADIIARFRTVQSILENLHSGKARSVEAVEAKTGDDEEEDDVSVSSRTRGRKRSSLTSSSAATATAATLLDSDLTATAKKRKKQAQL